MMVSVWSPHRETSEPWHPWMVDPRPTSSLLAVATRIVEPMGSSRTRPSLVLYLVLYSVENGPSSQYRLVIS